jgi:hypothetical protein
MVFLSGTQCVLHVERNRESRKYNRIETVLIMFFIQFISSFLSKFVLSTRSGICIVGISFIVFIV